MNQFVVSVRANIWSVPQPASQRASERVRVSCVSKISGCMCGGGLGVCVRAGAAAIVHRGSVHTVEYSVAHVVHTHIICGCVCVCSRCEFYGITICF